MEILPLMMVVWVLWDCPEFLVTVNLSRPSTWGQGSPSAFSSEVTCTVSWNGSPVPTWDEEREASAETSADAREKAKLKMQNAKVKMEIRKQPEALSGFLLKILHFAF